LKGGFLHCTGCICWVYSSEWYSCNVSGSC